MNQEPEIVVRLFAGIREALSQDSLQLTWQEGMTVSQLREKLREQNPKLAPWLECSMIALNGQYARGTDLLQPGDEVALIPPVSGG